MDNLIPYGGLTISAGAQTQSLTTTLTAISAFSAAGGALSAADTYDNQGNTAVYPDKANNRINLAAPGVYEVEAEVSGTIDTTVDLTMQVMKNAVAVSDLKTITRWNSTGSWFISLKGLIKITPADNPGTIPTMGTPAGTFTGGAGAPKTEVPITLGLASATAVITLVNVRFTIKRLG